MIVVAVVEPGDDWKTIAAAFGVTRDALWKANGGYRDLHGGEAIRIPLAGRGETG